MGEKDKRLDFLHSIIGKIGRLFGPIKRKDRDVYDAWLELCFSLGKKPYERALELMAWDLETGGINLKQVRAVKKQLEMGDELGEIAHVQEVAQIAKQAILENVKQQQEFSATLQQIMQDYASQIGQIQMMMNELAKRMQELEAKRAELQERERQIAMKEGEIMLKELKKQSKKKEK